MDNLSGARLAPSHSAPPASSDGFLAHLVSCCATAEPDLREFLEDLVRQAGFTIDHDDYASADGYAGVPNLLAVRGRPRVMLVAHTDTVRASGGTRRCPTPAFKRIRDARGERAILQDKTCTVQLGADGRLGVALSTWTALQETAVDLALVFTTDEEAGRLSAKVVPAAWFEGIELAVAAERGNHHEPQLVTSIHGLRLCSGRTAARLLRIAAAVGLPREEVSGGYTDVYHLVERGLCPAAVNMTCGFHRGHHTDEFVDIHEALDTLAYVQAIVRRW